MPDLYPEIEPHAHGMLEVGDGNLVYWETCGNPRGKTAVVLHGGPGSGCSPWFRQLFDPSVYRIILFDQRNCGRSRPHASTPDTDLANNNTANLIADIELLRELLDVKQWLVFGGSWGSTLALAYAEAHPDRVTEIILFGVTTGRHNEWDWTFRGGIAVLFPAQWDRLRHANVLADIPGILVNGRFDFQAPLANAWELNRVWPRAELVIVDDAGHAANNPCLAQALIRATDRFAGAR